MRRFSSGDTKVRNTCNFCCVVLLIIIIMKWNWFKIITEVAIDEDTAIAFAFNNNLLRAETDPPDCGECGETMTFKKETRGLGKFRCRKNQVIPMVRTDKYPELKAHSSREQKLSHEKFFSWPTVLVKTCLTIMLSHILQLTIKHQQKLSVIGITICENVSPIGF